MLARSPRAARRSIRFLLFVSASSGCGGGERARSGGDAEITDDGGNRFGCSRGS